MCGIFGIYGQPEAANLAYLGLHALQHRGQESAGIVTADGGQLSLHRGMGHVIDVFGTSQTIKKLKGEVAIGHVRYSTAGGSFLKNAQPIAIDWSRGSLAVAHNGNLTNAELIRERLEEEGSIFQSASDTEVIVHLIARSSQGEIEDRLLDALTQVEGAYSLLCLTEEKMIAVRDPHGFRPLCLGMMPKTNSYVVASEPSSFELIGAEFVRDVEPGELIVFDASGMRSVFMPKKPRRACIFEYVYFSRPDAVLDGISVYGARKNLGAALARHHGVDADLVIPVPDSGVPATVGYANEAKLPFEMGLVRSHYIGRTFIEPQQSIRHFGVRLKLSPVNDIIRGKRVVVVDDSIVRGTTSRKIVKMIRDAGAREVHLRIASPPTRWPCYYGIDTPTRSELIASTHTVDEINRYVTSDTLAYLSLDQLIDAVTSARITQTDAPPPSTRGGEPRRRLQMAPAMTAEHFCHACWSGEYPVQFKPNPRQRQLRLLDG